MRYIKQIETLIERAERNEVASINRAGVEVYRIQTNGIILSLYHYGTEILTVFVNSLEIVYCKAYSRSDCDAINTALHYYGIGGKAGFKPVNGGFTFTRFGEYHVIGDKCWSDLDGVI